VVYGAALYTTDPQAYIGAGQGLKVLKYGKTRNPAARRTDPNQAEPVDTVSGRAVPDQVLDTSAAADAGRDRVAVDAEPRPRRSRVRKKRSHQLSAPKPRPAPASRPEVGLSVPVVQVSAEGWVFGVDRAGGIVLPDRTVSGNQPATSERIRAADWHPEGTRFVRVSSGVKGLAALSSEGRVYYLNYVDGLAGNGPLVRGLLPFPEGTLMVDVAAGDDFVLAASADGRAHVLTIRRLPIGGGALKEVAEVVVADLPDGVRAVRVAAGHAHCVVLDSEGRVHAWGVNAYGQLGDGSRVDRDQPVLATAFAHSGPVVEIHASATATAVVTASGKIRQVGAVLAERRRARPVFQACPKGRAPGLPRGTTVTTMSLGEGHALALAKDGQVYAWGSNGALQLGCDPQIKVSARPRGVEGLPDGLEVTQLAAGEMYSIALATDGSACAWGWNEEGLLGIRSPDELQRRPAKMYWTPQAATPQSTPPPATPLPSTP
ncbi:MAG: hypothetical protein LBG11_05720, partial [Bifidobacteriaceae bacterium]|jgi:hypothetical protein|nr:hypothetical protein [Bifidobacteriaceae bacterium]